MGKTKLLTDYTYPLILARHLFYLQRHCEDEENAWDWKFYKILARLSFAMGFRGKAEYANKKELVLCCPLLETVTQRNFDIAIVPVIYFKIMQEPEKAIHTLAIFSSVLYSINCGNILKRHLDVGLNLVFISLNMLRYGSEDDAQNSAISLLVALVKSCSIKALLIISDALISELSSRGSGSIYYRVILYHAFEEIAVATSLPYISDNSILKSHLQGVIDALNFSLELDLTMDNEEATIGCEAALEAWIALTGEEAYQPHRNTQSEKELDCTYPTVSDENRRSSLEPSESTYKNNFRSPKQKKISTRRMKFEDRPILESEFSFSRSKKDNPNDFAKESKNDAGSQHAEEANDSSETETRRCLWCGPKIKLWKRKRTKAKRECKTYPTQEPNCNAYPTVDDNNRRMSLRPSESTNKCKQKKDTLERNFSFHGSKRNNRYDFVENSKGTSTTTDDENLNDISETLTKRRKWCGSKIKVRRRKSTDDQ